jgi:hypothetical protein
VYTSPKVITISSTTAPHTDTAVRPKMPVARPSVQKRRSIKQLLFK